MSKKLTRNNSKGGRYNAEVAIYDLTGKKTGEEIELMDYVFGVEFNEAVVHQAVVMQQANERQGTHATKPAVWSVVAAESLETERYWPCPCRFRSFPSVGRGGTIFGPSPRSHAIDMPRKARRLAIRCALSSKVADGSLVIVDGLSFADNKTKNTVEMLKGFEASNKKA